MTTLKIPQSIINRVKHILFFSAIVAMSVSGCRDLSVRQPAGTVDPKFYTTQEAAEQMGRNARYEFQVYILDFMLESGLVADEFFDRDSANKVIGEFDFQLMLDQRHLPDEALQATDFGEILGTIRSYRGLQRVRSVTSLAHQTLGLHASETSKSFRGELFAYEAFAEVMLADLYCSGIPLSTVDLNGDFTYQPGRRTREVYEHAVQLFDSALALSGNDGRIQALARIGKGRALLALGKATDAEAVVQNIPDGFRFDLPIYRTGVTNISNPTGLSWISWVSSRGAIADAKGRNGARFITSHDPRIQLYGANNVSPNIPAVRTHLVVADHIEARLIEAEARIQSGDLRFLEILNTLRTNGNYTIATNGDTVYAAGTGAVAGLRPLVDPATPPGKTKLDVRIDLLMNERAFWLFFTGHRQGDLRRLIRNYGRLVENTYPTGDYRGGIGYYDDFIDVPIPNGERFNPYFQGCIARGE